MYEAIFYLKITDKDIVQVWEFIIWYVCVCVCVRVPLTYAMCNIIYFYMKFHVLPTCSSSLIIAIKLKSEDNFCLVAILFL